MPKSELPTRVQAAAHDQLSAEELRQGHPVRRNRQEGRLRGRRDPDARRPGLLPEGRLQEVDRDHGRHHPEHREVGPQAEGADAGSRAERLHEERRQRLPAAHVRTARHVLPEADLLAEPRRCHVQDAGCGDGRQQRQEHAAGLSACRRGRCAEEALGLHRIRAARPRARLCRAKRRRFSRRASPTRSSPRSATSIATSVCWTLPRSRRRPI